MALAAAVAGGALIGQQRDDEQARLLNAEVSAYGCASMSGIDSSSSALLSSRDVTPTTTSGAIDHASAFEVNNGGIPILIGGAGPSSGSEVSNGDRPCTDSAEGA